MDRREFLKYVGAAGITLHPLARALGASSPAEASGAGIFLNQAGYLPAGAKAATVRLVDASQREFLVRSLADHTVVFNGKLSPSATDPASGDQTSVADFSLLRIPADTSSK